MLKQTNLMWPMTKQWLVHHIRFTISDTSKIFKHANFKFPFILISIENEKASIKLIQMNLCGPTVVLS